MHKLAYRCTGTRGYVFDIVHRCVTIHAYAIFYEGMFARYRIQLSAVSVIT